MRVRDNQRRWFPLAFIVMLLLAAAPLRASLAAAAQLQPFTIAVFQSEAYLLDYVAKDEGFGAKHGLDIRFVTPASGSAAAQLLLAGAVQGWATDPMIILSAAAHGYDIRMAGIVAPAISYWILVSKQEQWPANDTPLSMKLAALRGKRIGVSGIGAGTDHVLLLLLQSAHIPESAVTRIGIGQQPAAIGQLDAGRIDAYVSFSLAGNAMIERQSGAHLYISTQDTDIPAALRAIPSTAFAVSGDLAAKRSAVVAAWLAAEGDALAWIRAHPDEAAAILNRSIFNGEHAKLAATIAPDMMSTYFQHTPVGFKVSRSAFDATLNAAKQLGIVTDASHLTYDNVVIPEARP